MGIGEVLWKYTFKLEDNDKVNDLVYTSKRFQRYMLRHMDISAQGLRMVLELNKYHTKPNGTFLVNILILNFSICCSNSLFSFFILTCGIVGL